MKLKQASVHLHEGFSEGQGESTTFQGVTQLQRGEDERIGEDGHPIVVEESA